MLTLEVEGEEGLTGALHQKKALSGNLQIKQALDGVYTLSLHSIHSTVGHM